MHIFQREPYKGKTALHLAAASHPISLDTVIDLLDKRQNGLALLALLQSDAEGRLPLHLAVLAPQSAETLLKLMAWMGNYLDQVNLVEGWPENLCLDALNQALIWSIPHRDLSKIGCLLRLGANPNIKNNLGQTPLHLAAANNQVEIVKLLIGHKTLLDIQDDEGNTALHVAMEKQANAVMKMLLLESASTSIKNKKQLLPRQIAQIAGYTNTASQYDETIKELRSKEQNLLRHDLFGFFFLKQQRCIEIQQREILALLKKIEIQEAKITDLTIQHKAQDHEIKQLKQGKVDTNYFKIQDNKYNSFFTRYEPMLKNIRQERLGDAQNELVQACISGDLKQVKLAIQAGASPDLADSKNILPVGAAIYGMNPEIVDFLLSLSGNHTTMSWKEWEKHNKEKFQLIFEQDKDQLRNAKPVTYSDLYNGISGVRNRKIQECILSEARSSKDVGFSKAASSINSLLGHIINAKEWHNPYSEQGIREEVHFSDNYYKYPIGESNRYATSQAIWKVPAKLQAAIKEVFKKHHELLTASSKQPSNLVNIGSSASISSSSSNSSSSTSTSTVYLP